MNDFHGRNAAPINFAMGATTEIAKQCGAKWAKHAAVGGMTNHAGHKAVLALLPAGAVVVAGAPTLLIVAGAVVAGYGVVKLGRWLYDQV